MLILSSGRSSISCAYLHGFRKERAASNSMKYLSEVKLVRCGVEWNCSVGCSKGNLLDNGDLSRPPYI